MSLTGRADAYWTRRTTTAMGSTAYVVLGDAPEGLAAWAIDEIERLEQCWSRFRSDSELSGLNARAGAWVDLSAPMLLALTCARDLFATTRGLFDPTILDALEDSGYDRSFDRIALDADAAAGPRAPVPGFDTVEIDAASSRARIRRGARVDLGGLGKGLAADLVGRGAVDRGARSALVNLGGDMCARGEAPPEGAWRVPVEDPRDESREVRVHALVEGALVASTRAIRTWTRAGRSFHHIIDPRTGDSSRTPVVGVVAEAAEAWWAEGIAKAVMIAGVDDGVGLARASGVRVELFLEDGRTIESGA